MSIPRKDKIYVLLQFLVFIGWVFDAQSLKFKISENLHFLGLLTAMIGFLLIVIAIVQIGSKISPFPSPPKNARLKTTGAFAFSRHPIYSGVMFIAFGAALWLGSGFKLLVSLLLYLIFFQKSRYEERRLLEKFPEYAEYRNETGRFFPKFKGRI